MHPVAPPTSIRYRSRRGSAARHPQDLTDVSGYPHLIAELPRRGWPDADITLLTWGNIQRVLRSAEFVAGAAGERRQPSTAMIAELDG
ncbi:membrane dipeptidase [Streptomyces sp. A012304]|uniref:membrane dipeptidase n=1 Tax=Streptomyces sp. A012304 TaxID=375446 RepID=UPI0028015782|nr:hypothetical protein ALMP_02950 [Streptomyces sp. A012304]